MDSKQTMPSIELIQEIQESLISKSLTVSTAESLTAGMVGSSLATLPGASAMYQGGLIVYSDEAKINVLGVPEHTIDDFGAVSAECAMDMARRIREKYSTVFGVATTGNAGPGASEGKACGLVYVAVSSPRRDMVIELNLNGDRDQNRSDSTREALELLRNMIRYYDES